jgi:dipeptidase E
VRLFLSSYDPQGIPRELGDLVGENRRTLVIANANDADDPRGRAEGLGREFAELRAIGLAPEELDLRDHFGGDTGLEARLSGAGLVWARGGNSFLLRRAMRASGFDRMLRGLLETTDVVYGGYSAGAVVATPTLRGIELVDDTDELVPPYSAEIVWDGLDLVPYCIAPHFRSDYVHVERIDAAVAYFEDNAVTFRALRDGQTILVDGEVERLVDHSDEVPVTGAIVRRGEGG